MKQTSKTLAELAKAQPAKMSINGLYNYAAIEYVQKAIFASYQGRKSFDLFYKTIAQVTDAKTFFAYEFKNADIYVYCDDLKCTINKAFPEVSADTLREWIEQNQEPHHVLINKWW